MANQIGPLHPKPVVEGTAQATQVQVAADATNGIAADDLQAVLSALAARVTALEAV